MSNNCQSCEALMINGVYCHETGCPDSWKDYRVDCFDCGFDFVPKVKGYYLCPDCAYEAEYLFS